MHTPRGSVVTPPSAAAGTDADPEADQLWDALARARAQHDPRVLAAAEDGVFSCHLPLDRAAARGGAADGAPPVDAERAAELGLAEVVLQWE